MILRVTIGNLYSFNEETEISFVAGKSTNHADHVSRAVKRDDISVLKAGIIYGANASGKSNIIKVIYLLKRIALNGVPKNMVKPFKLAENGHPSKVEIEFKTGRRFYAYGVEFNIRGIVEEWLYEINSRTDKLVFTRKTNEEGNDFEFGNISGGEDNKQLAKFIGQGTPKTDSFLSEYIRRNGKGMNAIKTVHTWMKDSLKIIFPESHFQGLSIKVEKDKDFAAATKSLLEYFNTGIVDIKREKIDEGEIGLSREIIQDILSEAEPNKISVITLRKKMFFFDTDKDGKTTIYEQKAVHLNDKGERVAFDMEEESDGSFRLLDFIPMLIDLQLNDSVYLIDELDRSMHPMMSMELLKCYLKHLSPSLDTQMIFTTHESNLLNLDIIRADEVWFVEKDRHGASRLTSLAEYKPREDVHKGYLQGRYGGIPFFASTTNLNWNNG